MVAAEGLGVLTKGIMILVAFILIVLLFIALVESFPLGFFSNIIPF